MNQIFFIFVTFSFAFMSNAQESLTYQTPSSEILELVNAPNAPNVKMDSKNNYMIFLYRNTYKSISELSEKEMRLGGLRINPKTNIGSRVNYFNNIKIQPLNTDQIVQVKGLPKNPRLSNLNWSPDEKKIAFTHTTDTGVEVWILNLINSTAQKLTEARVNANMRDVVNWFKDSSRLLVKMLPQNRKTLIDVAQEVPSGPIISINKGKKAQNRTYQDLLKNKSDEHNFEQLSHSEIYEVSLDGTQKPWLGNAMYENVSFSPDGNYVMITTIEKPFSYLVTYRRFASKITVYDKAGTKIKTVVEVPLIEDLPKGFMATRKGKRSFNWRSDLPASLIYAQALDEGDPAKMVSHRDEVFQWDAPFIQPPKSILKTINRFSSIQWGTNDLAIAYDNWWDTRNTKTYIFDPSDSSKTPLVLFDLNSQDTYSDPGSFVTKRNDLGRNVLALTNKNAFLIGKGFSEKGQFPFVDQINLSTQKTKRLYQSSYTNRLESLRSYDVKKNQLLVRIESKNDFPNYYFRNLNKNKLQQITFFKNPFQSIQTINKEVITYQREDGLELSGTLYLPLGYDTTKKEKMPMILWAYPREFKDKTSASQNTQNPNEFTSPFWGSPIYWVTKGYVVLDDAAFPIIGEGNIEPNDSFRAQLVSNAKAAIDAVDKLGYIDRERVAVGGHSYGAFMVANLLSHSDLFAAGIARSGAYNRTLTPFGFQSEQRSYWEAPEVYYTMSPFMHANKMKTPLLLVHGEADNNSGTYPLQSTRYFNALKGLGATVRLVMLPKESHGYRAKESILHLLWEQDQWLEKYVKNK